jgi:hypothetical protein
MQHIQTLASICAVIYMLPYFRLCLLAISFHLHPWKMAVVLLIYAVPIAFAAMVILAQVTKRAWLYCPLAYGVRIILHC